MIYTDHDEQPVSKLGLGTQRFVEREGFLDEQDARVIVEECFQQGINLFETSCVYHEGKTEELLGNILKDHSRETYAIATKFNVAFDDDIERVFEEQLRRLQTNYIDFYMFHCLNEDTLDAYKQKRYLDFLMKEKQCGRIRHLGFSTHAKLSTLQQYLNDVSLFDFVMLQLNYVDWILKDVKGQYDAVCQHHLKVWAMQPLRNSRALTIKEEYMKELLQIHPDWSLVQWGLRFISSLPAVEHIVSGMGTQDQIVENANVIEKNELTEMEQSVLIKVSEKIVADIRAAM